MSEKGSAATKYFGDGIHRRTGHPLKKIESLKEFELIGVQPRMFALGEQEEIFEFIRVYEFESEEKRELALQEHRKRQMMLSSLSPIIYQKGQVLVLYHPGSRGDTKFNEKLNRAMKSLNFEAPSNEPNPIVIETGEANQVHNEMPEDFAFLLRFGVDDNNMKNVIDSYNGIAFKDLGPEGVATANVKFTREEMLIIYEKMQEINIFGPKELNDETGCAQNDPRVADKWTIRIAGEEKTVHWVEYWECKTTDDAKQLNDLRNFILEIVFAKEEYKKLPESKVTYE